MMSKEEFNKINALENNHWWYVGTREISFAILEKYLTKKQSLKILDVGCGTGGNLKKLLEFGEAEGIDVDAHAVELCKIKGYTCKVGGMENLNLQPAIYDLITFYDVITQESQETTLKILNDVYAGLKKDGIISFREPAMKIASGRHDIEVGIKYRFNKKDTKEMLKKAGFNVVYVGYINSLLFLPIVIKRKIDIFLNSSPKSDVQETSPLLNSILLKTLRIEKWILKYISFPFGLSLLVVAQKT